MPGVYRAYTWVDVLGTLNGGIQDATQGDTTITATSQVNQTSENANMSDTATGTLSTNLGWNQTTYGAFVWS